MHEHEQEPPAHTQQAKLDKEFLRRWWHIAKPYWTSKESRKTALGYFAILLGFLFFTTMLNKQLNGYLYALKNALAAQNQEAFFAVLPFFIGLFVVALPAMVFKAFFRDRAALSWRISMTKYYITRWLSGRAYFHINENKLVDNPDERIHQDVDHITGGTLVFTMLAAYALFNIVMFTPMLAGYAWYLPVAGLIWAAFGTWGTRNRGIKLVEINYDQRKLEANFRSKLIGVRTHTESIAFYNGEEEEKKRLVEGFDAVANNTKTLVRAQRNLTFYTQSYEYINMILPMVCIGPLVILGTLKPGAVDSAQQAFGIVMGSLSILVSQFKTLADLAADVNRLYSFDRTLSDYQEKDAANQARIAIGEKLVFTNTSVVVPADRRILVTALNHTVEPGKGTLVVGPSGAGKSSLLRTGCGLWPSPTGSIEMPADTFVVPQDTYLWEGTLRSQLLYPKLDREVSDAELVATLRRVNLVELVERVTPGYGGVEVRTVDESRLNEENKWQDVLSPGMKQRISFARLFLHRPKYAVLDESTSALDVTNEGHMYREMMKDGIARLSVGHRPTLVDYHDDVLVLTGERGTWKVLTRDEYRQIIAEQQAAQAAADARDAADVARALAEKAEQARSGGQKPE